MLVFIWCALIILCKARNSFGGNVLITIDLPSPSHQIWHYALAEGLMEKGHNVTLFGPLSNRGESSEKYHSIVVEGVLDVVAKIEEFNIEQNLSHINVISSMKLFITFIQSVCNHSYHSEGLATLLNYPPDFKFDLIIIDMTTSSCFYPLIQKFNYPPTIGTTPFLLPQFISGTFGNDLHPSYIPFYQLPYAGNMSFFQRVLNYLTSYADYILKQTYEMPKLNKMAKRVFGSDVESMQYLERHISLLLSNIDPVFNQPQPLTPNIIPVGGLHIKPSKKLPEEFQDIMDAAEDGVILFCLGTNARSDKLGAKFIETLLRVFGQLKQTVIWKFESDMENVPKNVFLRQWVPQSSILGHHNMKFFISHGGALSTQEAAYYGVPVICMPFFIDQRITAQFIVDKKLGLRIEASTVTFQQALDSINEMLNNPVYSANMKEVSRRMRDRQNIPLDTAVFWSEYAMRHNGCNFLSPMSRDISHFVSSSADVEIFLMCIVFLFLYLLLTFSKKCKTILAGKSKKKVHYKLQ